MMRDACKAHPFAETVGGICWYCQFARRLRATKRRTPGWNTYTPRSDAESVRLQDERAKMFRFLGR